MEGVCEPLAENHLLSVRRLRGLLQWLKHDLEILKEYERTIQEQLAKGVIEPLFPNEKTTNQVHYLPHYGVVCSDKATTKLRWSMKHL